MDAIMALVISMLPKLRRLVIWNDRDMVTDNLYNMFRSAILAIQDQQQQQRRLPAFRHLREVDFRGQADIKIQGAHDPLLFLYLPNIRELKIKVPNQVQFSWPGASAPRPSQLRLLEIYRPRESQFGSMLSALTGLRYLTWKCACHDNSDNPDPEERNPVFDLDKMAAVLSSVGKTLIGLTLDVFASHEVSRGPRLQVRGSLKGMLSGMPRLKALQLPWEFAMGFSPSADRRLQDVIPLGVEELFLQPAFGYRDEWKWDAASVLETLTSWLGGMAENSWSSLEEDSWSSLETLTVTFKKAYVEAWGDIGRRKLESLAAEAGVEVIIRLM